MLVRSDARRIPLPDNSVQCVVTSPPYWGLRAYAGDQERIWGGNEGCEHDWRDHGRRRHHPDRSTGGKDHNGSGKFVDEREEQGSKTARGEASPLGNTWSLCGAWRGGFGLEPTIEMYVQHSVEILREVRRVLRPDGVCFWNLGDSYSGSMKGHGKNGKSYGGEKQQTVRGSIGLPVQEWGNLKAKDLCMIPARVALAAQQPYYAGRIKRVEDRVWMAAMIDAEGCMFIHRRKAGQSNGQGYLRQKDNYGPGLEVANTSENIVKRCMEIVGLGSICSQGPEENNRRKQRIYRWNLRTTECRDLIREVYPHLVGKQQQARILCGCPPSGETAAAAHAAMIGLHNGISTDVDFPAPESMYEPGWYLRSDVIWNKLNPMPESVTDRPTDAYEHIFMLTKSARYYWDVEAVKEKTSGGAHARRIDGKRDGTGTKVDSSVRGTHAGWEDSYQPEKRNLRNIWTFATAPYKGAHFATFPPELVIRCLQAATKQGDLVLDPFGGSGTVGMVAFNMARRFILCDLAYHDLQRERIPPMAGLLSLT